MRVAKDLDLSFENASTATYHDLHRCYLEENGLPPSDSFYFTEKECQQYIASLECEQLTGMSNHNR